VNLGARVVFCFTNKFRFLFIDRGWTEFYGIQKKTRSGQSGVRNLHTAGKIDNKHQPTDQLRSVAWECWKKNQGERAVKLSGMTLLARLESIHE